MRIFGQMSPIALHNRRTTKRISATNNTSRPFKPTRITNPRFKHAPHKASTPTDTSTSLLLLSLAPHHHIQLRPLPPHHRRHFSPVLRPTFSLFAALSQAHLLSLTTINRCRSDMHHTPTDLAQIFL